MRPTRSDSTGAGRRRAWEPPTVTRLAIGTETKSQGQSATSNAPAPAQTQPAEPSPPARPDSKLGFSFEMGFPLSARTEG
jgi:hypothetical protein